MITRFKELLLMRGCAAYSIRIVCALMVFFVSYNRSYSQQIATVGVIDVSKLYTAFPKESGGYGDLEQLKKKYQIEIDREIDDLELLKRKKVLALKEKDYKLADSLDKEINRMTDYITSISNRRQRDLIRRSKSPVSKKFLQTLQDAIAIVAEEKGYTLIFKNNTDGLQWWAPIVDITDDIIKHIQKEIKS